MTVPDLDVWIRAASRPVPVVVPPLPPKRRPLPLDRRDRYGVLRPLDLDAEADLLKGLASRICRDPFLLEDEAAGLVARIDALRGDLQAALARAKAA